MRCALIWGVIAMTQVVFGSVWPAAAETFAYVGNADSNEVQVFSMDAKTGGMTLVEKVPFVGIEKAGPSTPMAVSPDKRILFVGVRSQPFTVVSYAIDPKSGKLQHLGNSPLADSMAYIATDRRGQFLLSASYGGNKIAINPIDTRGVAQAPSQVIPTGLNAHAIQADPSNRFVLATNLGSDAVLGITTRQRWFAFARLLGSHLTDYMSAFPATLTTPALDRRSLRWFAATACTAATEGPPPSPAQHRSVDPSSTSDLHLVRGTHGSAIPPWSRSPDR